MATHSSIARRAATAALMLLLAAPLPAAAQGFSFSFGSDGDRVFRHHRVLCLTDSQLRRSVAERGYTNIYLNAPNNNRLQVRATRGDWVYLLRLNACTGRILARERLRPA